MSNAPKHPSSRNDLKRWDNEGGAPRSGHHRAHGASLSPTARHPALYYFNVRTEDGLIDDPEGSTHPGLQAARDQALSEARRIVAEGGLKGEDRRGWSFEITDRTNHPVLTVRFSEALETKGS
ncbi:hypothetical protein ILT44_26345 [Microvirga sp. BT689]|uniref:DUF6894 family protein n=1 Tax=Microvirga arvi TaxID=2778731 RepID=UPI001950085B|nr:hypothetical protein [Microvirga arvi]MBM6583726.1 hypothetical protein [Microvirga arvi]